MLNKAGFLAFVIFKGRVKKVKAERRQRVKRPDWPGFT